MSVVAARRPPATTVTALVDRLLESVSDAAGARVGALTATGGRMIASQSSSARPPPARDPGEHHGARSRSGSSGATNCNTRQFEARGGELNTWERARLAGR